MKELGVRQKQADLLSLVLWTTLVPTSFALTLLRLVRKEVALVSLLVLEVTVRGLLEALLAAECDFASA